MSKKELEEINKGWNEEMINDGYEQFMTYQPFSDKYWDQKVKIVFCNLETYDLSVSEPLTHDIFKGWLIGGNPTLRYTSVFISGLNQSILRYPMSVSELKELYHNEDHLLESVKNITYMNLRKEPNDSSKENTTAIREFLDPKWPVENSHHIKNFKDMVKALEPDIFIITGQLGADILRELYKNEMYLEYDGITKIDKTLFVSLAHPSTSKFNYQYIESKIKRIIQEINS